MLNFRIFRPISPCGGQNCCILNLYFRYLTVFWVSELVFWVSELVFWVSELISLVSELISLVLGVWNYTLGVWTYTLGVSTCIACVGCLNLYFWASEDQAFWGPVNLEILKDQAFWYDLWIWKYWPSILVWPVNLEILMDWNLWTSGPFQDHGIGTLGLLDHLG